MEDQKIISVNIVQKVLRTEATVVGTPEFTFAANTSAANCVTKLFQIKPLSKNILEFIQVRYLTTHQGGKREPRLFILIFDNTL